MTVLIGIALKSLLIAGLTLGLLELMKRRSAGERSWVAHSGLFALVLMAIAPLALPNWNVEGPALLGSAFTVDTSSVRTAPALATPAHPATNVARQLTDPAARPASAVNAQPTLSVTGATIALYAIPAAILLFITFIALARLVTLRARADVLVDAHWLSALARAQRRMGFKHGTALLTSDELASPISWGVMRPVIVLNSRAVEAQGEAEAIIAHELAHVARMDWVKLLLARVATAMFWFNPLVWLLAREAHQLREETADDAVLAADIPDTDYAQLLVGVARHETPGLLLGAHGVAPSKNSLARRVARVLDGKIVRGPVAGSFAAGVFVGAIVIAAPLAALTLVPSGTFAARNAASTSATTAAYAPYYPQAAPADLPSIIGQGVSTSVQSAVAAIDPKILVRPTDHVETIVLGGASARRDDAVEEAIVLRATGVTSDYIAAIRAAAPQLGPLDASDLSALKAVGVTPAYIRELSAAGFSRLDKDDLVEAAALNLRADYVRGLASVGYGNLTLEQYSELKAVGVTPEYVRSLQRSGFGSPRVDKVIEMRALGVDLDQLRSPPNPPRPPHPVKG
ncbi:MAG: M56 family metallopeptidase, partial [Sphingomicrobium sp.]